MAIAAMNTINQNLAGAITEYSNVIPAILKPRCFLLGAS
jgi:hypothetical protein